MKKKKNEKKNKRKESVSKKKKSGISMATWRGDQNQAKHRQIKRGARARASSAKMAA